MRKFKYFLIILPIILIIFGLGMILIFTDAGLFPFPIKNMQIEKEYSVNQKLYEDVANYLNAQEYDSIYITSTSNIGEMYGGNYLIGYISLANGDFNLAASSLEKVVDYENFKSEQLTNDYKFALAQNKSTEE